MICVNCAGDILAGLGVEDHEVVAILDHLTKIIEGVIPLLAVL